jgi:hypothetical protein
MGSGQHNALVNNAYVYQVGPTATNTYAWYDGAVQSQLSWSKTQSGTTTSGSTTYTLGAAGQLNSASIVDGRSRTVTFTNDMNGQALRRDEADSLSTGDPHEVWYRFAGREMGYTGNNGTLDTNYAGSITNRTKAPPTGTPGPFRFGATTATAYQDFDPSLDPINSYSQGSSGGSYTVREGDTLAGISVSVEALELKLPELDRVPLALEIDVAAPYRHLPVRGGNQWRRVRVLGIVLGAPVTQDQLALDEMREIPLPVDLHLHLHPAPVRDHRAGRIDAMSLLQPVVHHDMGAGRAQIGGGARLRPLGPQQLDLDRDREFLVPSHRRRRLGVQHDSAVALLPGLDIGQEAAAEAVFEAQTIGRIGRAEGEMPEAALESVIAVIGDADRALLHSESAIGVLAQGMAGDLRRPAVQRSAVEELLPALFVPRGGVGAGGGGKDEREKGDALHQTVLPVPERRVKLRAAAAEGQSGPPSRHGAVSACRAG